MWPWSSPSPPPAAREPPVLRAPDTASDGNEPGAVNPVNTTTAAAAATTTTTTPPKRGPTIPHLDIKLAHSEPWTGYRGERLTMPLETRAPLLMGAAFMTGLLLGGARGAQVASDRYRAENAHRQPSTEAGWYLYQRSKNYNLFLGACQAGARSGIVLSLWAAGFMLTEEGIDQLRGRMVRRRSHSNDDDDDDDDKASGQRDFVSTVVAALAVAGVHSRLHHLNSFTTVKTSALALKAGLAFGLVQDGLACLRGRAFAPAYLRWLWPAKGDDTSKLDKADIEAKV